MDSDMLKRLRRSVMASRITVVLANWCPHCVPLSLEKTQQLAKNLKIPLQVLNIDDPDQERAADTLVRKFGDDAEDYLIPQVFLERDDGTAVHLFTGFSEAVSITAARWDDFFSSQLYRELQAK